MTKIQLKISFAKLKAKLKKNLFDKTHIKIIKLFIT